MRARGLCEDLERSRAQGRPGARQTPAALARKKCARARRPQVAAESRRPSLRSGLTAYFVLSSVNQLVCHRHRRDAWGILADLAPAWARQDHTTWPYANVPLVRRHNQRPPHSASRFVTIAIRPLQSRRDGRKLPWELFLKNRNIFSIGAGQEFCERARRANHLRLGHVRSALRSQRCNERLQTVDRHG